LDINEALAVIQRHVQAQPQVRPAISWARLWELYSADPPVSASTFTTYGYLWAARVGGYWSERDVASTTEADVAAYRAVRRNELTKRGGRVVRPATRNREVMLLRTLATWGRARELIAKNPLEGLDDEEEEDNIRETVLTDEMLARAQPWLPHYVLVYVVVVLDSGLRRGEGCALKWGQVDFEHGVIALSRKGTKGRRSRYTTLSARAAELLGNLPRLGEHVFHNPQTLRPYTPDHFLKKWRAACQRGGVKGPDGNVTIHDMRRTFATEMRRASVQESEIMAMGGWTTAEVFTRYNVVNLGDVMEARKKLEAHLRRRTRRPPQRKSSAPLTVPAMLRKD
jgi:integrase